MCEVVNIKRAELLKNGYENIRKWLENSTNLYIGRKMRIFIHNKILAKEDPGSKVSIYNNNNPKFIIYPERNIKLWEQIKINDERDIKCGFVESDKHSLLDFPVSSYVDKYGYIVEFFQLDESIWHNPFKINNIDNRQIVIDKYVDYIKNNSVLLSRLGELKDKTLGCFCAPDPCHGYVLKRYLDKLQN